MYKATILFVGCFSLVAASCAPRNFINENAATNSISPNNLVTNYPAFDAFLIWRDGKGLNGNRGVLTYPSESFGTLTGSTEPDGVFYVSRAEYFSDDLSFIGKPTEGVVVEGDITSSPGDATYRIEAGVLVYPNKSGRKLDLKFTAESMVRGTATVQATEMTHAQAQTYCSEKGLRLPTSRELFDFCATNSTKDNDAYNGRRCSANSIWSASVNSSARHNAWIFSNEGRIGSLNRTRLAAVRCVGF